MSETPDKKAAAPAKEKKAKAITPATDSAPVAAEASAKPEVSPSDASTPAAAPVKKVETAADLLADDIGNLQIRRAKGSKNVTSGICHIGATFNNTMVTFTDKNGNTIAKSSSGKCGFKGAKKSTAYAAQVVCQDAAKIALSHGLKEVEVRLKGPGMGRDSAVRALQTLGLGVTSLIDVTPVPHNGCRARKRRRV
jgi:small subunit ribosomal protein S11